MLAEITRVRHENQHLWAERDEAIAHAAMLQKELNEWRIRFSSPEVCSKSLEALKVQLEGAQSSRDASATNRLPNARP